MTKFGRVAHVGSGVFRGVSHAPPPKGRGPSTSQLWGFPLFMPIHPLTQNDQIQRANTYRDWAYFRGLATPRPKRIAPGPALTIFLEFTPFMPTPFDAQRPNSTW